MEPVPIRDNSQFVDYCGASHPLLRILTTCPAPFSPLFLSEFMLPAVASVERTVAEITFKSAHSRGFYGESSYATRMHTTGLPHIEADFYSQLVCVRFSTYERENSPLSIRVLNHPTSLICLTISFSRTSRPSIASFSISVLNLAMRRSLPSGRTECFFISSLNTV